MMFHLGMSVVLLRNAGWTLEFTDEYSGADFALYHEDGVDVIASPSLAGFSDWSTDDEAGGIIELSAGMKAALAHCVARDVTAPALLAAYRREGMFAFSPLMDQLSAVVRRAGS